MKNRKIQVLGILLMFSFVMSSTSVNVTKADPIETNFTVWHFTQSGSRTTEAYALYFKQAFAPLGIDVKIIAKPFGQFVGDLLHLSTGHPFDIAQVRFGGGGPSASMNLYLSSSTFGNLMYQLTDPGFQAWQEIDTGVVTDDLDALIQEIEFSLDFNARKALTDEFAQLYMEKLLYSFPMVSTNARVASWKGFGGPDNELYFPAEGTVASRELGASYDTTKFGGYDSIRATNGGNDTNLRFGSVAPAQVTFDNMNTLDNPSSVVSQYMREQPFKVDQDWGVHPGLAYNYFIEDVALDWDNNGTIEASELSYSGHIKMFFRDDAWWLPTTDYLGAAIPTHKFDANDMLMWLDTVLLKEISMNGADTYWNDNPKSATFGDQYFFANVSTTVSADDTLDIYIAPGKATLDDWLNYDGDPLPEHILGGNLHWSNTTDSMIGTAAELDAAGINAQESDEWVHWASLDGHSNVGAMDIKEYVPSEFFYYEDRADYFYPNEWDTTRYYGDGSAFAAIEAAAENLTDGDLGIFAPHINTVHPVAHYWAFDSNEVDMVKPATQGVTSYFWVIIEDINANLLAFEAGAVDFFTSTGLGAQQVSDHELDASKSVTIVPPTTRGPELLVFNLKNENLKKLNVRMAMASVIDLDKIVQIHDGFAQPIGSPVYVQYGAFYEDFTIGYNYGRARDLMRFEGYVAQEDNNPIVTTPQPPISTVITTISEQIDDVVTTLTDAGDDVVNTVTDKGEDVISNVTEVVGAELWFAFIATSLVMLSILRKQRK